MTRGTFLHRDEATSFPLPVLAACVLILGAAGAAAATGPPCASPPCGSPPVPATATVTVDCDAGESVQDALATPAEELTVEIRGLCREDVVIERDDVVLSGRDPALDGLRGAATDPAFFQAVLRVVSAERVRVERLSIAEGVRGGINVDELSADVTIEGCNIFDTARDGVQATGGSSLVRIVDSTITDHGRSAIAAFNADFLECTRCTLDGDVLAVLSVIGSRIVVSDSVVTSPNQGVGAAEGGALVALRDSTVASPNLAVVAQAGEILATRGSFEGAIVAFNKGLVTMNGVDHVANDPGFNFFGVDSVASLVVSSLRGFTIVEEFSEVVLRDGSTLDGDLVCQLGGDAYCAAAAIAVTGSANCARCAQSSALLSRAARLGTAHRPVLPERVFEP